MSVQSEIDRINGAKSTLAANIESAGFTAGERASIVQLASTVGDAFTDTSSRLATVNGTGGTISTQLDTLNGTKTAIKDAIVAKGVEVPEGTTFYEYAGLIDGIETEGGYEYFTQKTTTYSSGKYGAFSLDFEVKESCDYVFYIVERDNPSGEDDAVTAVYIDSINKLFPNTKGFSVSNPYGTTSFNASLCYITGTSCRLGGSYGEGGIEITIHCLEFESIPINV